MSDLIHRARAALRNATIANAIRELDNGARDREVRRLLRQPRGAVGYGPPRCGGCRRWLASTRERCSCGFNNDVRGARNLGGYTA